MEGISYLNSFAKYGIKPGLDRIKLLLDYLGNPETELNIIHIGGTNGKGSTSALLTSIYTAGDYKVGTYNSPHIIEFKERIRINDQYITDQQLTEVVAEVKPAVKQVEKDLEQPSFFEVVTAVALVCFARQKVDLAILEVGMGGRWDATNIGDSLLSIITNVSLDHTEFLGTTIKEIAQEKAGIINQGQPVVTAEDKEEALTELKAACAKQQAKLINVREEFQWKQIDVKLGGQKVNINNTSAQYKELFLPLLGEHQIMNLLTALAAVDELKGKYPVAGEQIKQGVAAVNWPGRLEVVASNPAVILDGAHNLEAAENINRFLSQIDYRNLILVIGILADKDSEGIINQLAEQAEQVIITQNQNQRAAEVDSLAEKLPIGKEKVELIPKLSSAVKRAQKLAPPQDLILISGSLYTVKEARKIFLN